MAVTAAVLAGFGSVSDRVSLAASLPSQQDVESVYLFDFAKFVRWPVAETEEPIRICVAATPSFLAQMQKIVAGEHIDGREIEVRRVAEKEDTDGCAILFVDVNQRSRENELMTAVEGKPTLTVSDAPGFLERGGMIQFQVVHSRVRFAVNLTALNHGSLSVSSELLKVAVRVQGTAAPGGAP